MTIYVRRNYGEGGAGLAKATATAQHRPLPEVLRGLIDDIEARKPATIASPDAVAADFW